LDHVIRIVDSAVCAAETSIGNLSPLRNLHAGTDDQQHCDAPGQGVLEAQGNEGGDSGSEEQIGDPE
jgi:hypothetical protein